MDYNRIGGDTMESGFYKNGGGQLLYAPNYVYNKAYELLREDNDQYNYPVDGWRWFETRQEAVDYYGIVEEEREGREF